MSLANFLLARIAEDKEAALAASTVRVGLPSVPSAPLAREWAAEGVRALLPPAVAEHVARHDPARVLRRCEADRRIVEDLQDELANQHDPDPSTLQLAERTLLTLALPYADHPDYDEAWRP